MLLWVLVLAGVAWLDLSFLKLDYSMPREDSAMRLLEAVDFHDHGLPHVMPYPPLTYMAADLSFDLFGMGLRQALAPMTLFHLVFIAGLGWTGRQMTGRIGGVLVLLGASGVPAAAQIFRAFFTDVPQSALVALCLGALLASQRFTRRGPVVVLGLALGLGMLARWTFVVFIGFPLVYELVSIVVREKLSRRWIGMLCAVLVLSMAVIYVRGGNPDPRGYGQGPAAVLYLAWLALLVSAMREWRDRETGEIRAGVSFVVAASLGNLVCLWWYVAYAVQVFSKVSNQVEGWGGLTLSDRLRDVISQIHSMGVGAAIWVPLGICVGFVVPRLRRPTVLIAGAAVTGLVVTLWLAPGAPRYLLPSYGMLVSLAFAWPGLWPRLGALVGLVTAFFAVIQTGWWHPALGVAVEYAGTARPFLPAGLKAYPVSAWASKVDPQGATVPATLMPETEVFDLEPVLRRAAELSPVIVVGRVGSVARQGSWLEEQAFVTMASLSGFDVLVVDHDSFPVEYAMWTILIAAVPLSSEQALAAAPWLSGVELVECGSSQPPSGGLPQAWWCLAYNANGVALQRPPPPSEDRQPPPHPPPGNRPPPPDGLHQQGRSDR